MLLYVPRFDIRPGCVHTAMRRTVICDTYNSAGELALEEMPQSEPRLRADILSAQAQCLGAQGQKEQSLQKALLAKDEDPGYGNVWTQLAAAYMNVGQDEKCDTYNSAT